ncbi:MAG: hypothetical protein PHD48_03530 [Alphaproteobacteria bacterium]|nr:hypothetical protein [Alphaproteobacteria bacterium]
MMEEISLAKVISLAFVDAVNPCAFAVLTMMIISIIAYNPNNKANIIWSGVSFSLAIFVMYLVYGLFIIKSFQLVQNITTIRPYIYKTLGSVAILLGFLQIKDFFFYKIGSFSTEMPASWRPNVKALISKVTSPVGAFGIGLFVTLFLLPCTIGPYIILGGLLSVIDIVKTLPTLLLYNSIFVSPMLLITLVVYFGLSRVEDVQTWKDKNIRVLHLISGLIILGLGVAMIAEWI